MGTTLSSDEELLVIDYHKHVTRLSIVMIVTSEGT